MHLFILHVPLYQLICSCFDLPPTFFSQMIMTSLFYILHRDPLISSILDYLNWWSYILNFNVGIILFVLYVLW